MENSKTKSIGQILIRLITGMIILAITAFFTPGFDINGTGTLLLASIILTVLDYTIAKITGLQSSPFGKGFVGFVLAALTLYLAKFFIAGYTITLFGAFLGALVYGVVDFFIPGENIR